MTDNQKKLEELLLQHIENETKAICETNNILQTALALIELWKITSERKQLEKRIADLERKIQSQQEVLQNTRYESATDLMKELEEIYRKATSN